MRSEHFVNIRYPTFRCALNGRNCHPYHAARFHAVSPSVLSSLRSGAACSSARNSSVRATGAQLARASAQDGASATGWWWWWSVGRWRQWGSVVAGAVGGVKSRAYGKRRTLRAIVVVKPWVYVLLEELLPVGPDHYLAWLLGPELIAEPFEPTQR